MEGKPKVIKFEEKTEGLPVDATGAPLIVQCPASGCKDLDLWTMAGAGGRCWIVTCGAGHLSFITRKEDQE